MKLGTKRKGTTKLKVRKVAGATTGRASKASSFGQGKSKPYRGKRNAY